MMAACALPVVADEKKEEMKDTERIEAAANVMKEILGTPDKGIPKDLLNKADCVVDLSVGKESGVHRRRELWARPGDMPERRGRLPVDGARRRCSRWKAQALASRLAAQATDFVLLVMNESGANSIHVEQGEAGRGCVGGGGAGGAGHIGGNRRGDEGGDSFVFAGRRGCLPACRGRDRRCGRTTGRTRRCMAGS